MSNSTIAMLLFFGGIGLSIWAGNYLYLERTGMAILLFLTACAVGLFGIEVWMYSP